jgi:hypothetical protein
MKKLLLAAFIITGLGCVNSLSAQEYKTALGIRLSSSPAIQNNSISFKHFINEKTAIEGLISFGDPMSIGGLVEFHQPFSTPGLQWFYGAGGYLGFGKEYNAAKQIEERKTYFGGQGVVGLDYKFASIPINISLDWKPELNLISDINFEPAAIGFSARFTFGK